MKTSLFVIASIVMASFLFAISTTHIADAAMTDDKLDIYLATPTEWAQQREKLFEARRQHFPIGEGGGIGSINSYQSSYREYVETAIREAKKQGVYGQVIVPREGQNYLNGHGTPVQSPKYPRQNIEVLPESGKDSVDTSIMTGTAGLFIVTGTIITFRKRSKSNK